MATAPELDDRSECAPAEELPGWSATFRQVVTIAVPLVVSTLSWTIMHFIDRVLLLGYSADSVAAATPAGMMSYAAVCLPLGIAGFANTFVAQYHGAEQPEQIGRAVWQGIFIGLASIPAVLLTIPLAPAIFAWGLHSPEIFEQEVVYYQINAWGGGAIVLSAALRSFFTGRGRPGVVMVVDTLGAITNIGLDLCWIYGYAGFPRAGIAGAAWATVVALWLETAIYFGLFLRGRYRVEFGTWSGFRWDGPLLGKLIRFGLPSGLQMVIDVGALWAYLMAVGRLGGTELAATSLAWNVNGLAFMPVYGLGLAATTLVGQYMGAKKPRAAARMTWASFAIAGGYMAATGVIYVAFPDVVLFAHWAAADTATSGPAVDPVRLRQMTEVLLWFVAGYSFSDAMAVVFSAALKGAGDTGFVLVMALLSAVFLALSSWVAVVHFETGLFGLWWILTGFVALQGVGFWLRFLQGRWRSMRVIDESHV